MSAYKFNDPVKAGIVDEPESYRYSSARDYAGINELLSVEFIEQPTRVGDTTVHLLVLSDPTEHLKQQNSH